MDLNEENKSAGVGIIYDYTKGDCNYPLFYNKKVMALGYQEDIFVITSEGSTLIMYPSPQDTTSISTILFCHIPGVPLMFKKRIRDDSEYNNIKAKSHYIISEGYFVLSCKKKNINIVFNSLKELNSVIHYVIQKGIKVKENGRIES